MKSSQLFHVFGSGFAALISLLIFRYFTDLAHVKLPPSGPLGCFWRLAGTTSGAFTLRNMTLAYPKYCSANTRTSRRLICITLSAYITLSALHVRYQHSTCCTLQHFDHLTLRRRTELEMYPKQNVHEFNHTILHYKRQKLWVVRYATIFLDISSSAVVWDGESTA